ncbi:helix-turn-helix domain-containing protein [Carbonactinospora thermoautotrophica]|uniref:helix-turn-helix domain-containing protein n=1 Tax=Carbonactinospora thermoautotrophica TaxID=1469144 RepID=UPI0022704898|nr:PucR family transcriptional regulator ligand-binding domain-containing protein [Carbonactinospora thermoautotrophica]
MLPTLAEVLALPAVAAAAPEVLHGDPGTCTVRWVHSSEIYEMGPLLRGGELLLTTGLGLHGRTTRAQAAYVDALADAGLSALALELGRTFGEVPAPVLEAARRRDLSLIALHQVVPFAAIVEAFHELLLRRRVASLRLGELIWQELLGAVLSRRGLPELLATVAALAGCPAHLVATDGRLVASSGSDGPAVEPGRVDPDGRGWLAQPVRVHGQVWGRLLLVGRRTARRAAVLERATTAVALELLRAGDVADRDRMAQALIQDLFSGRVISAAELGRRGELAGFPMAPGRPVFGLAVAVERRASGHAIRTEVAAVTRTSFGPCLVAEIDHDVVAVTTAPGGEDELRTRLAALAEELGRGHVLLAVAAGAPGDPTALGRSLAEAREAVGIARRLGARNRVLLARDVGVYRLLARLDRDAELGRFLREQLGPLLDHDATHGTDLVRTLDAYLTHGLSKTAAAAALGVRRQTLYNRLARIESVLGALPLADHERRTALGLALLGWRLRTGLDPTSRVPAR